MKTYSLLLLLFLERSVGAGVLVQPVDWSNSTNGRAGPVRVTLSTSSALVNGVLIDSILFGDPVTNFVATGPEFLAAPLPAGTEFIQFAAMPLREATWTITFSRPVFSPLLYAGLWRGNFIAEVPDPTTAYSFDHSFVIVSGLERARFNDEFGADTILLPDDSPWGPPSFPGLHSGIIQFPGVVRSLSVTLTGSGGGAFQVMTFAIPVASFDVEALCPCAGPALGQSWRNHGEYVSCVARAAKSAHKDGQITNDEKNAVIKEAAQSNCGKK